MDNVFGPSGACGSSTTDASDCVEVVFKKDSSMIFDAETVPFGKDSTKHAHDTDFCWWFTSCDHVRPRLVCVLRYAERPNRDVSVQFGDSVDASVCVCVFNATPSSQGRVKVAKGGDTSDGWERSDKAA